MHGSSTLRAFSLGFFSLLQSYGLYTTLKRKRQIPITRKYLLQRKAFMNTWNKKAILPFPKKRIQTTNRKKKETPSPKAVVPARPKTVLIKVQRSIGSLEVARILEKEGIIKNASDFQQYWEGAHLTNKLRVGTYKVEENMSFDEIGKFLTKQTTIE
jgi:hypothetical protein